MTTEAIAAYGVTLTRDGNAIAMITNIDPPEITRETIDVTSHGSSDTYREYIAGLKDGGEMSIEGNFKAGDTDGQIALLTDLENGTLQSFVMTFPTAITATLTFSAYVTKFKAGPFPVDGKVPFSATFKISGKPALAITAATGPTNIVVTGNVTGALTLTPTYAAGTYEYLADGSGDATVDVTVTAAGADTITVNGNTAATGVATGEITLTADAITTITVVVGETGKVSKTYTIRIIGPSS
jgi:predicted secreted protein